MSDMEPASSHSPLVTGSAAQAQSAQPATFDPLAAPLESPIGPPADSLLDPYGLDQPAGKRSGGAEDSPYAGMYDDGSPDAATASGYQTPWASAYLTGITDEQAGANAAAETVTGHDSGVALYQGTSSPLPYNMGDAALNNENPLISTAANVLNAADTGLDLTAVTQFANMSENVQIDENGQLVIDHDALSQQVQIAGENGEQYMSPEEIGRLGADTAMQSNPALRAMLESGGEMTPEMAQQFISLTGHSGGGQSSFYTALELYQRGFTNVSLVGYDMAINPHQREMLEQLGIPVTNFTGHTGDENNYVNSGVGEVIRSGMGGDLDYYDASIERGGDALDIGGQHGVTNNAEVTTMLRYASWLDSQGMHQQWSDENYATFLEASGQQGNVVDTGNGPQTANNPLNGLIDYHQEQPDYYLSTPEIHGQDIIDGLGNVPLIGGWLGEQADNLGNALTPNFEETSLGHLDLGLSPNIDAHGSVDLNQGAAEGGFDVSGTTIDALGAHVTVPEWAQGSGAVNLSEGTGNFNLGGDGGVGADVNLGQGNLDLNVFGNTVDVDQGIQDFGAGVNQGINDIGQGISNGISGLGNLFGSGN